MCFAWLCAVHGKMTARPEHRTRQKHDQRHHEVCANHEEHYTNNITRIYFRIMVCVMSDSWTFFTNHAHVLFVISEDPEMRLRDVAERVGITERAAQRIVAELEERGFLEHEKVGRRNRYEIVRKLGQGASGVVFMDLIFSQTL